MEKINYQNMNNFKNTVEMAMKTIGLDFSIETSTLFKLDCRRLLSIVDKLCLNASACFYFEYNLEFHLRRICREIEKGNYKYKKSKLVQIAWRKYKKERWREELNRYGFRLRWQIRLNRWIPYFSIRLPSIDECIDHRLLRIFSCMKAIISKWIYLYKNMTLKGFYYFDIRYGTPVLINYERESPIEILFKKNKYAN